MTSYILAFLLLLSYDYATGQCNFPCKAQKRLFDRLADNGDATGSQVKIDASTYTLSINGTEYKTDCVHRSGPFYVLRRTIDGVVSYICLKNSRFIISADFLVLFRTEWKPFPGNPTVCDVCTGKDYVDPELLNDVNTTDCKVVHVPGLGCNLPFVCPITDPKVDKRCTPCEPSEASDDGLCCA
ncbi:uncharacterized protein [Mytilus edulis]|uniref:uncharacterized protein n=1 Tax=Mytilus edulis TaxID=6550 RepID=UPI0039F0AE21